jgi:hypothetical protein
LTCRERGGPPAPHVDRQQQQQAGNEQRRRREDRDALATAD